MCNYPTIDMKATGARICELRKKNGLRVTDISDFMGFTEPQAVYKWQRGDCLPTLDNIYALSILFHTTIENIIVSDNVADDFVLWELLCTCAIFAEWLEKAEGVRYKKREIVMPKIWENRNDSFIYR